MLTNKTANSNKYDEWDKEIEKIYELLQVSVKKRKRNYKISKCVKNNQRYEKSETDK